MPSHDDRYREERLLLALARGRRDEAAALARGADWERAAALVAREIIGGYLYRATERDGLRDLLPGGFLASLAAAHRKTTYDNLLLLARLRDGAAALRAAAVPFVVLKGGALLADVYPDLGTRSLTDIDLLVRREDAERARASVEALGWKREVDYQIAARRCGYVTPEPGSCIFEIHWDLSQRYRYQADLDRLWGAARPLSIDGIDALRLGEIDEMVYLALHYAAHYFGLSIKWLVDLLELIRLRRPDWEEIGRRARSWRGSSALHAALLFLRRSAPEALSAEDVARAGRHPVLGRLLARYFSDDPLRFLKDLPYGPRRLVLAALLQDRASDRLALAWLTQVRGHAEDD